MTSSVISFAYLSHFLNLNISRTNEDIYKELNIFARIFLICLFLCLVGYVSLLLNSYNNTFVRCGIMFKSDQNSFLILLNNNVS